MASKLSKRFFHLAFSITMAAGMAFVMTAVVTAVNVGLPADFLARWMKAFGTAFLVAAPVIYLLAPQVRRLVSRFVELP